MANANRTRRITVSTAGIVRKARRAAAAGLDQILPNMNAELEDKLTRKIYPPASRPGQYPAMRTGRLSRRTKIQRDGLRLIIKTTQYGIWLQGGTRRIAPRKLWREAFFEGSGNKLSKAWLRRINDAIRRNAERMSGRSRGRGRTR